MSDLLNIKSIRLFYKTQYEMYNNFQMEYTQQV